MKLHRIGLDVGSTTIKTAVLDRENKLVYSSYERHYSDIKATVANVLNKVASLYGEFTLTVTGSGGISVSEWLEVPFVQEVIAGAEAVKTLIPETDVAIELGGEDAKITYFKGGTEQRMNGTCAGGTGAFIDQMASLLGTDAKGLDSLARDATVIYPIASRCGVFAKSDIQPLLNDGAKKSDIAASIFQSVVNQTISGLACGKPIRGVVAFLGGPLSFLPGLGKHFIETLQPSSAIFPANGEVYNAIGAAILGTACTTASELKGMLLRMSSFKSEEIGRLRPLFSSSDELTEFRERHSKSALPSAEMSAHSGAAFLGIDAGSTTTKAVLINEKKEILFSRYGSNGGDPLKSFASILKDLYAIMPTASFIGRATVTGYGEHLIKTAFNLDAGEIETLAHQTAGNELLSGAEFVLDIGGQDMKCLRVKDGVIRDILLNEACSSGCGSFIEAFASALGLTAAEFAEKGLMSASPVDLGSRCTVFMNSRVKQSQKEGAGVADISAGLAYSVIKNALFKVIKIRDFSEMGSKVIVQGGTFLNDSVLRAFELIAGREAVRPVQAGLMGAYGAAVLSLKEYKGGVSTIKTRDETDSFRAKKSAAHCYNCGNNCLLTISEFSDGRKFVTNNRCERGGAQETRQKEKLPNLFEYKYDRLFRYQPLSSAPRGRVGIPRVLNIYENYPFWFTFFTNLGYRVELSPRSSRAIYNLGIETMPSESVCYPAKLAHGHVEALVRSGINYIFYPCIPYEIAEDTNSDNHYNCPIVCSYPENIRNNMRESFGERVRFHCPFLPLRSPARMLRRLYEEFPDIPKKEIGDALKAAYAEDARFKEDIIRIGSETVKLISERGWHGIVLAGRPYHLDPEINHGIPEMINSYGFAVLTEDSVSGLRKVDRPLRVVDQWMYHSRLYSAAEWVRRSDSIDLVQLNSFGCGLDAVTADQVQELLEAANKLYTVLKIDEVNNLGAARIRIRSLISVIKGRKLSPQIILSPSSRILFTKKMKKEYTILSPQISPFHMRILQSAMRRFGYRLKVLEDSPETVEVGLKYVNNDACYPTLITVGSLIAALQSGKYEIHETALIITQTGGGCRATNYISLIRKALLQAGLGHIPVISFSLKGLEKNPGFKISFALIKALIHGILYGDLFMRCLYKVRPYEIEKGSAETVYLKWTHLIEEELASGKDNFAVNCKGIVADFDAVPICGDSKPAVGIVGEILVKYHPLANNNIVDLIEKEGGEAVVPDFIDFFLFGFQNGTIERTLLDGRLTSKLIGDAGIWLVERYRRPMKHALEGTKFGLPSDIRRLAATAQNITQLGNIMGEGWFLTAEMLELMHNGVYNIVCVQPFACLPNHVTGKGVMKEIKRQNPMANIVAVDYDPGASEVNQLNRIKLMLSNAFKNQHNE